MEMWNGGSFAWKSMGDGALAVKNGDEREKKLRENVRRERK